MHNMSINLGEDLHESLEEKVYIYWLVTTSFKGMVFPKLIISPWFTHPQGILGVYDFLLSDESNRSYIKKMSWLFQAL